MTDTSTIRLAKGNGHNCADGEGCLFEWYNWLTVKRSQDDRPADVSPVLHQFGMNLNDCLPDGKRQELVRFLPNGTSPLAGTYRDGKDETRGYMALDWLIRTYTPAWLDLAGLTVEAAALRDLRRVADLVAAQAAGPVVRDAGDKAAAAWAAAWDAAWAAAGDAARDAAGAAAGAARDAAGDAAWAAAWDAAGDAARAAARDAARAAARDAAGAAAGDAAWAAAGDAAGDAAWAAAWDAAGDAARAAARDAARAAAGAAARAAAWDRLTPTVASLQDSAISLYDRMITGVWPDGL